jgi:hypothetical protein
MAAARSDMTSRRDDEELDNELAWSENDPSPGVEWFAGPVRGHLISDYAQYMRTVRGYETPEQRRQGTCERWAERCGIVGLVVFALGIVTGAATFAAALDNAGVTGVHEVFFWCAAGLIATGVAGLIASWLLQIAADRAAPRINL